MDNPKIMVVLGEPEWTSRVLHLACAIARSKGSEVILLRMIPVRHPLFLGTDLGYVDFSFSEQRRLKKYEQISASYGVNFSACVYQYIDLLSGLVDASDKFDAAAILAVLPQRLIPFWHRIEVWWLKRALSRRNRSLFLLEQPDDELAWTPLITLLPESDHALPTKHPGSPPVNQRPLPETHDRPKV